MLQTFVKKLGARCVRSPKYHCEIAGEGIEYSWENSKMKYRRTFYSQKSSTSDFILLVGKCLSREYLHRERVRKIQGGHENTWLHISFSLFKA